MQQIDPNVGEGYTTRVLQGAEKLKAMLRDLSKPLRTVLRWQLLATAALMLVAGIWAGAHGALSALLGGSVSVCSGLAAAGVASLGKAESALPNEATPAAASPDKTLTDPPSSAE